MTVDEAIKSLEKVVDEVQRLRDSKFQSIQTTHHADCWREHHECAIKRVNYLEGMLSNSEATATYYNHEFMRLQQRVWELEAAIREHADQFKDEPLRGEFELWCHVGVTEKNGKVFDAKWGVCEVIEPTNSPTE